MTYTFPYVDLKEIRYWGRINWVDIQFLSELMNGERAWELQEKVPTQNFLKNNPEAIIYFHLHEDRLQPIEGSGPVQLYIRIAGIIEDFKSLWENLIIISEYIPEWVDFHFVGKRK